MSQLFILELFLVYLTASLVLYSIKKCREPLSPSVKFTMNKNQTFWQQAEKTNGRLAMIGLMAAIINYGFFGWIAPGFF